jgi:hypothetical protein
MAKGAATMEGSHKTHGEPLKPEEIAATKTKLGLDPEAFFQVSDEAKEYFTAKLDTYNLEADAVAGKVTPRTKAILPVHLVGQVAEMNLLLNVANKHGLAINEDAAQAIGAQAVERDILAIADAKDSIEDVNRSTLRINTRKWLLGVWNRKRFGDVKQIEQNVNIDLSQAMQEAQARLDKGRTVDVIGRVVDGDE